ncbi:MAG: glycosyltransferase family 2 protein [Thermodesulfobacteriota bacterium]|jgi:glycosyltransferase involved in cell wall biosynthesis
MPLKTLALIPAYNEEVRIADVLRGIRQHIPHADILVVNDGSTDRTREVALRGGARVTSHPFNLGYGTALQTGYKYALMKGYDELVQMDGDGQHDPSSIVYLLAVIQKEEADIAIGSRFLEIQGIGSATPPYRAPLMQRLGMRLFGMISSLLIYQKVTDPTSGFQAMNRRVLECVSTNRFPCDYPDADVIIMLHRAGFRIREVPVVMFENRDKKSMHSGWKPLYYVFKMFLSIFVTLMRK